MDRNHPLLSVLSNNCGMHVFKYHSGVCKATGACWAHNPDVHESNTSSAICKVFFLISAFLITTSTSVLVDTIVQIPCIMKRTVIVLRKQHVFKSHALWRELWLRLENNDSAFWKTQEDQRTQSWTLWGSVAEWCKALDLGSSLYGGVGSNPTTANSFKYIHSHCVVVAFCVVSPHWPYVLCSPSGLMDKALPS